mmetsp:Transcript_15911/g.34302  ORF Transcript_15911/g.34302 Transcript_15911/m.34302 type:complete len:87 (-) Transcript_15911:34-294(-)
MRDSCCSSVVQPWSNVRCLGMGRGPSDAGDDDDDEVLSGATGGQNIFPMVYISLQDETKEAGDALCTMFCRSTKSRRRQSPMYGPI